MNIVIHPTYFPNIATFVAMVKAEKVYFEIHDNYQKQTYRNRAYIYGANGKLALTVPVFYTQKNRQLTSEVKISNTSKWQAINWKSIQSAYRTSPFFEFYEDELKPLFFSQEDNLLDYNFKCLHTVLECLQLDINFKTTNDYKATIENSIDYRPLVNVKNKSTLKSNIYTQVFSLKHGFIPNLSILDLLFNEGPNALTYLESQQLTK